MVDPNSNSANDNADQSGSHPLQRIDVICDEFESEWLAKKRPNLRKYLAKVSTADQPQLFVEMVRMDLEYRREAGEVPTRDEYKNDFPEHASELTRAFSDDRTIKQIRFDEPSKTKPPSPSSTPAQELDSLKTFANYDSLEEIARGGMGVVYKARQTKANRTVALKTILSGQFAGEEEIARFKAEAEAVAHLDHPNIVPIFEVGEHDGHHFFSMSYVDGMSLKERIQNETLSLRESADLVHTLAKAIEYAHSKGIIHRDLKPANILIDQNDGVRITDFGLSKMLDHGEDLTGTGQLLGTPSYMSPEQASGDPSSIGPSSDVYSLGAILYELICGRKPFHSESLLETLDQVRSIDPAAPRSVKLSIDRDIETICLKCLAKEPAGRYSSAAELADDLQRYLRHEPILARRIHPIQRVARWCKRRPVIAGLLATVIGLSVVLGPLVGYFAAQSRSRGTVATAATEQASDNLQMATEAANQLVEQAKMLADVPKTESHRQQLLDQAADFYRKFLKQSPRDPQLRLEAAKVHRSVGDLYRLLGEFDQSKTTYDASIDLLSILSSDSPDNAEFGRELANSRSWLGVLLTPEDPDAAMSVLHRAIEQQRKVVVAFPDDPLNQHELARALYNRGIVHGTQDRLQLANDDYLEAIRFLEPLSNSTVGESDEIQRDFARTLNNFGNLLKKQDRPEDGLARIDQAIALLESASKSGSLDREGEEELAIYYNNHANALMAGGDSEQAMQKNQQAIDLLERMVGDYPRYPKLRNELANTFNSRGAIFGRAKEFDNAEKSFASAERVFASLVEDYPSSGLYANRCGLAKYNLAVIQFMEKSYNSSESMLRDAIQLHEQACAANPDNEEFAKNLRNDRKLLEKSQLARDD